MDTTLTIPTKALVRAACEEFDRDYTLIEETLKELFAQYPDNTDHRHILLKVLAVNALYSTQIRVYAEKIPNVLDMAKHVHHNAVEIDKALANGSAAVVDLIATPNVPQKPKRRYFSFATKYCSWHKPDSYPIWDTNVRQYLVCLQEQTGFPKAFEIEGYWQYPAFRKMMTEFRRRYHLDSFTFKEIDKFLWSYGGE